ncbi:hypothetical protein CONPUDRAFT_118003 [Coniophora puteana RWD-64-598 SS2]|uniref:High-temperature-induced dauer-formation protein n=1 Tax=Coniophora puteana (strain RWD-64-598) TaxID=741705 RepID=A0A5M3N2Y0_CONPW|nr:uncharacterized protein CONPUDRAFT_118003 [Coniophora puteana RWD-64-598 SS2]EIW85271.1 hypothetical protein CONPUDRAFT_118003 [Coniophora puteana RWD-64-598 SS2]
MFAKFPQKLTAPFGLLSDEAKLAFRSKPDGISKLFSTRNISETDAYWDQYFTLFDTPSDVFSLITSQDVRRALLEAPENVAMLIRVTTSRLFNLVSDHTFPTSNPTLTSYASSFMKVGTSERNTTKEVLNSLRVLQRVLPAVFEVQGESNAFELEILWKKVEVNEDQNNLAPDDAAQFVIEDDDDSDNGDDPAHTALASPSPSKGTSKLKKTLPSLGEKLFGCIMDLLFCCGFTLPSKIQVDHYKINYVIWEKGVGSTTDQGPNAQYDSNKVEVLRLLLVLLSRQIYVPPSALFNKPSFYSLHIVRKMRRRDVLTLLCSLMNTALNTTSEQNISIGNVAGKLPYNHLVFKGEDSRMILISMCLETLCALLDFQSGPARDIVTGTDEAAPTAQTNAFRYFLAKLHRSQDFVFILNGLTTIWAQQLGIVNNLLPGSRKSLPYVPDTVILFWKLIELNKKFRAFVLDSDHANDILGYLLCYSLDIKDKPQQHGMCRAISYIIQTLSAEPAFGSRLSSAMKIQVPSKWATPGTTADFMIIAIYSIVATTSGTLNSLYPALIISLSNAAPYFKNLSVISSTRLMQLFASFSNPHFLLSDESHPRLLFFLLEMFNSIISHHLTENPHLLYAILSAHKTFEDLGTFTLARGLRDIQRSRTLKEEQTHRDEQQSQGGKGLGQVEGAHEEKARLLRTESDQALGSAAETVFAVDDEEDQEDEATGTTGAAEVTRPLMSPTSEISPPTTGPSEKVKGKMRARRSISVDEAGTAVSAASVGRNGFVPTQEWVTSWQQGLPLDVVMLVISELLHKVQNLQAGRQKAATTGAITDFLRTVDLSNVLPATPPLYPRHFVWSDASVIWLTSLIWGDIYVRGMSPLGIWNATNVRLFYVKHAQAQQRPISEAMTSVVGFLTPRGQRPERT